MPVQSVMHSTSIDYNDDDNDPAYAWFCDTCTARGPWEHADYRGESAAYAAARASARDHQDLS